MSIVRFLLIVALHTFTINSFCQVSVNENNLNPDPSAMLDVQSTNKGVLVPRLTTSQREMIGDPATGLLVWDSDTKSFWFFNQSKWIELIDEANSPWRTNSSNDIYTTNSKVGIGTSNPQYPIHINENGGGRKLAVDYTSNTSPATFTGLGGDENLGLSFYAGSSFNNPGMLLSPDLRLGIGQSINPSARLHVLSEGGIPAFKVEYNAQPPSQNVTAFMVHTNAGVSIGEEVFPPADGLAIKGDIQTTGNISNIGNMTVESTAQLSGLTMKGYTSDLLLDGSGIYATSPGNIILQTTQKSNKLEINDLGIAAVSEENIHIETTGLNKSVTLTAGTTSVMIDEDGGITITSNGNNININSNGGNIAFDAGGGDFTVDAGTINLLAQHEIQLSSPYIGLNAIEDFYLNTHNTLWEGGGNFTLVSQVTDIVGYDNFRLNSDAIEINSLGARWAARINDPVLTPDGLQGQIINGARTVLIGEGPVFPVFKNKK